MLTGLVLYGCGKPPAVLIDGCAMESTGRGTVTAGLPLGMQELFLAHGSDDYCLTAATSYASCFL